MAEGSLPETGSREWHLTTAAAALFRAADCGTIGFNRDHFLAVAAEALDIAGEPDLAEQIDGLIGSFTAALGSDLSQRVNALLDADRKTPRTDP